jgi:hypothetical protein
MWLWNGAMAKGKNKRSETNNGKKSNVEKMDAEEVSEQSSDDKSPDSKKRRTSATSADDSEFDSSTEFDDEDQRIADYITKKVTKDLTDSLSQKMESAVSNSVKSGIDEIKNMVAEAIKTAAEAKSAAEEAKMTAETALDVAKKGEARIGQVEQSVDAATKTADAAKSKAEEAVAMVQELGKQFAAFSTKTNVGQPGPTPGESFSTCLESTSSFEESVRPAATASDRLKKLFSTYKSTIHEAKTTRTFILGRKKGETEATLPAAKIVMECFFPDIGVIVTKTDRAKVAKVYVPVTEQANQLRVAIKSTWAALASQGWWLSEDQPQQLTKLETRARNFIAEAKKHRNKAYEKVIGFVTVEYGMAYKDGKEILPLLLIPPETSMKWPDLYRLFAKRVEALEGEGLMGDYASEDDDDFYLRWIEAAGLEKLAADVREVRGSTVDPV